MILSSWEADYLEPRICPLKNLFLNLIKFLFQESSDPTIGLPVHFQSLNVCKKKLTLLKRNTESKPYILSQPSNLGTTGKQEMAKGDV